MRYLLHFNNLIINNIIKEWKDIKSNSIWKSILNEF